MDAIVKKILRAPVYDVAVETPLEHAPVLSRRLGNDVYLKREDLQPVFSFKLRGAYTKLIAMGPAGRERGVIAASAGNHAQGVALAAARLGTRAVIVMPVTTPTIKVAAVRAHSAEVVLFGDTFDEARRHAEELGRAEGLALVHPYDDEDVIAGQGTVGMEILRQHRGELDAIFVPVGGGGLIAGVAAYVKYVSPRTAIIGVEPEDAASFAAALAAGSPVTLPTVGIFADGVAVARVGDAPWRVARELVDRVVIVSTDQICAAVRDLFDDTRSIAEPAGALAVAGLKRYVEETGVTGRRFVAIDSGANVNFDRLRHISERAEIGEEREAILGVTIPERPGAFRRFCEAIGRRNITEFNYRIHDADEARIYVGVTLARGGADRRELVAALTAAGYAVVDLTESELAKLHIRHMVGGRSAAAVHERVYRFEFPERPGALMRFLERLTAGWNISMFHYRNDGAAFGRVVVGMQVPPEDAAAWGAALADIGYAWWEDTDAPAYRLFLGPG